MATNWQNRIVGEGIEQPGQLLANPANWRVHPKHQQEALRAVLDAIGWVQRVIVNTETGHLIDGHLRVEQALKHNEPVPVLYVKLSLDEEKAMLAALDPLSALATTDDEKLRELRKDMELALPDLHAALHEAETWAAPTRPRTGKDGSTLSLIECAIAEPTHQVGHGDVYRLLGRHVLVIADVLNDVDIWKAHLNHPGRVVFAPYPGPVVLFTKDGWDVDTTLVMVQPDHYVAGHILDQCERVHGADAIVKL